MLAATLVVLAIFLLRRLGSYIGEAADGSLPADAVLELLSLRTIMGLPALLTIGLYLGIVLGLGRLHRDQEITALASCGIGPGRIFRDVMALSFVVALLVGALSLFVRSWAANLFDDIKSRATKDLNVSGLAPGRFWEIGGDDERVIFIEHRLADGTLGNVFVQERQGEDLSILFAERATERVDRQNGYRFLTLLDGYRYDLVLERGKYDATNYASYVIRAALPKAIDDDEGSTRADSTMALVGSSAPSAIAELQWRIALPISAFLLALIAIPLSRVRPAGNRYAGWFTVILIYLAYSQLLSTTRHWVADGQLPTAPGLWGVHALFAVVAIVVALRDPDIGVWRLRAARAGRIAPPPAVATSREKPDLDA